MSAGNISLTRINNFVCNFCVHSRQLMGMYIVFMLTVAAAAASAVSNVVVGILQHIFRMQ